MYESYQKVVTKQLLAQNLEVSFDYVCGTEFSCGYSLQSREDKLRPSEIRNWLAYCLSYRTMLSMSCPSPSVPLNVEVLVFPSVEIVVMTINIS